MKHQKRKIYNSLYHIKRKIPDPDIAKEYYNSYLKRKNTKSLKRSKIFTQQLKAKESTNIVDIK